MTRDAIMGVFFMDDTPKIYTEDPFSYNYISLKKSKVDEIPLPSKDNVVADPVYNEVGKALGLGVHEWKKLYDKVFTIAEWAKERSGFKEPSEIIKWINDKIRELPNMGAKKINSLYNNIMLGIRKGKNELSGRN